MILILCKLSGWPHCLLVISDDVDQHGEHTKPSGGIGS